MMEGADSLTENSKKFISENKERKYVGGLQCFTYVDDMGGGSGQAMAGSVTQFLGDSVAVKMAIADAMVRVYMEDYDDGEITFEEFVKHIYVVGKVVLEQKKGICSDKPDEVLN